MCKSYAERWQLLHLAALQVDGGGSKLGAPAQCKCNEPVGWATACLGMILGDYARRLPSTCCMESKRGAVDDPGTHCGLSQVGALRVEELGEAARGLRPTHGVTCAGTRQCLGRGGGGDGGRKPDCVAEAERREVC